MAGGRVTKPPKAGKTPGDKSARDLPPEELFGDGASVPVRGRFEVAEPSKDFLDALDGDHEASLRMWRGVARGQFFDEERAFVHHVANAILDAYGAPVKQRNAALTKAIGLFGRGDQHRALREVASGLADFGVARKDILDELERRGNIGPETKNPDDLLDHELRKDRPAPGSRRKKS